MSPYQYSYNSPVNFNDPMGDYPSAVNPLDFGAIYADFGAIGRQTQASPGSGNYWADGSAYSDWTPNGGSDTYRAGVAMGLTDLGGKLFSFAGEERNELYEEDGSSWINDNYIDGNGNVVVHATQVDPKAGVKGADSGLGPETFWDKFGIREVDGWMVGQKRQIYRKHGSYRRIGNFWSRWSCQRSKGFN
jgi:hypothetical protein